jgi:hypothetical protein
VTEEHGIVPLLELSYIIIRAGLKRKPRGKRSESWQRGRIAGILWCQPPRWPFVREFPRRRGSGP